MDLLQQMTLHNGSQEPQMLVEAVRLSLRSMFSKAEVADPQESLSWLGALYDLYQVAMEESPDYKGECVGCFGGNREKILKLGLVKGDERGTLKMDDSIRNIVQSALTYDPARGIVSLRNPVVSS